MGYVHVDKFDKQSYRAGIEKGRGIEAESRANRNTDALERIASALENFDQRAAMGDKGKETSHAEAVQAVLDAANDLSSLLPRFLTSGSYRPSSLVMGPSWTFSDELILQLTNATNQLHRVLRHLKEEEEV